MHLPDSVTLPHWRSVARHAIPNIAIGKLIPSAVFIGVLQVGGTRLAILGALLWSLAAIVVRLSRGKRVPGLLWLTTIALISRTVVALATGSTIVYFLQPTVATCLVAVAFLVSVPFGRPLFERVMLDFCPLDDETRAHPVLRRFFNHVSLWWGFTSLVNFSITVWLLLSQSTTTFVLVKSVLGTATTSVTLAVAFLAFRATMARSGTQVVFAERT